MGASFAPLCLSTSLHNILKCTCACGGIWHKFRFVYLKKLCLEVVLAPVRHAAIVVGFSQSNKHRNWACQL